MTLQISQAVPLAGGCMTLQIGWRHDPAKNGSLSKCGPVRRGAPRRVSKTPRKASLGGTVLATEERAWIWATAPRRFSARRENG